jgi:cell division protein FtsZ
LLEEASIEGAKGVLVNITGGQDLTLFEVDEAMRLIHDAADPDANIIFGTVPDERMENEMKITVIATGFEREYALGADRGQERVQPLLPRSQSNGGAQRMPVTPSNQTPPPGPATPLRQSDDLDVPTFIRKKAD